MSTAAATLSSESRSESFTPEVEQPAAEDVFGVDADDLAELVDDHELAAVATRLMAPT